MIADTPDSPLENAIRTIHPYLREAGDTRVADLRLPNLLGIGTSRAGTSTLYGMLRATPDIYAAPIKELNYFGICDTVTGSGPMSLREYRLCFAAQANQNYIAEVTPIYLTSRTALRGIKEALGPVKLIVTLRNPFDRLVSHFKYHRHLHGYDDIEPYLMAALSQHETDTHADQWTAPRQGLLHSLYAPGLETITQLFSWDDVLILYYDDIVVDGYWANSLTEFLGTNVPPIIDMKFRNQSTGQTPQIPEPLLSRASHLFETDLDRVADLGMYVPLNWRDLHQR